MAITRQPRRADTNVADGPPTEIVGVPPALFNLPDSCFAAPLPKVPGYEIIRLIDQGGMSNIYLARQLELERLVAIKMIRPQDAFDDHIRKRFLMEASSIAALQHPNVVQIYEIGEVGGVPFLCLEYIDGGNLERKIHEGKIGPRAAARITRQLAVAMDAAHRRQIIHRDLKPSNVLCVEDHGPDLTVKITDFGLARMLHLSSDQTKSGYAIGTPSFMSPEQASGRPEEVHESTDIYGLGAILYELLTGSPPFEGATALETIQKVRYDMPTPPSVLNPTVPRALERICLQCLEKSPQMRYPTAGALADDLDRFLNDRTVAAHKVGPVHRWLRRVRRQPANALAFVTLPALAVAAFIAIRTAARVPELGESPQFMVNHEEAPDPLHALVLAIQDPTRTNPLKGEKSDPTALAEIAAKHSDKFGVQYAVGDALLQTGQADSASGPLQRAAQLAEERTRSSEGNFEAYSNLAFALHRLGDLKDGQGNGPEAKHFYERSMQIREMLVQDDPRDPRWGVDLAATCGKLATLAAREGDLNTALQLLFRKLGQLRLRHDDIPSSAAETRATHLQLAEVLDKLGNAPQAEKHRREAEALNPSPDGAK